MISSDHPTQRHSECNGARAQRAETTIIAKTVMAAVSSNGVTALHFMFTTESRQVTHYRERALSAHLRRLTADDLSGTPRVVVQPQYAQPHAWPEIELVG